MGVIQKVGSHVVSRGRGGEITMEFDVNALEMLPDGETEGLVPCLVTCSLTCGFTCIATSPIE
jgi:hypothetical protein